jgi:hypothetical protein
MGALTLLSCLLYQCDNVGDDANCDNAVMLIAESATSDRLPQLQHNLLYRALRE